MLNDKICRLMDGDNAPHMQSVRHGKLYKFTATIVQTGTPGPAVSLAVTEEQRSSKDVQYGS